MKGNAGDRGLVEIEECVADELRQIHFYISRSYEKLLKVSAAEEGLVRDSV